MYGDDLVMMNKFHDVMPAEFREICADVASLLVDVIPFHDKYHLVFCKLNACDAKKKVTHRHHDHINIGSSATTTFRS